MIYIFLSGINVHFLIASTNKHKTEEIEKIFNYANCTFSSLAAYDDIPVAVENGKTFLENATIKAKHYYKYIKKPVIADDSGLVVPALNGAPGIHSARYAGEESDYNKNNSMLLEHMAKLHEQDRYAFFIPLWQHSVLQYLDPDIVVNDTPQ